MGKRSAVVELFLGDMGSMQRELRPSTQREDQLTMETKLEQIAVKAVNQLPKSVVREIRTPRSVGAGGGRPPPATRWARDETRVPTATASSVLRRPGIRRDDDYRELFRINFCIGIAQNILLHLAHGVARQFVDDDHPFRHLEFCKPAVQRLEHRGLIDAGALVANHDGGDALAEIRMRYADHGGFDHAW